VSGNGGGVAGKPNTEETAAGRVYEHTLLLNGLAFFLTNYSWLLPTSGFIQPGEGKRQLPHLSSVTSK